MAKDDKGDDLAALVSDASADPRMKDIAGDYEPEGKDEDEAGDTSGLEDCLNRAFDAKEKGDRAAFVSAMIEAIQGR